MKKFALALMAAAIAVLGAGMVAEAYPPGGNSGSTTNANPAPGESVTYTVSCTFGELIGWELQTESGVLLEAFEKDCEDAGGTTVESLIAAAVAGESSATFTAPTAAGTYTVTATGSVSGDLGSFSFTIAAQTNPTGGLPATGSDGVAATTWIAGGLLIVGLGLFGVAAVRRRQPLAG